MTFAVRASRRGDGTRLRAIALGAFALLLLPGCRRGAGAAGPMSQRVTIDACPAAVAPASPGALPPKATLTVVLRTTPAVAAGTETNVKIDGETFRSSVRVDVSQPSIFELDAGIYIVRVALSRYTSAEGRAVLTAGCATTMTMSLSGTR